MTDTLEKAPVTHIVHWASGPVPCCEEHAKKLVGLGNYLGSHIACTKPEEDNDYTCVNCENEEKNDNG